MENIQIFKTKDVKTPSRGTPFSAGIDFFIPNDFQSVTLYTNEDVLIPSGIKAKIPHGYALVANNKSGVATKKKLICGAAVVDQDYHGEIHLHLINIGPNPVTIKAGEKILQFILEKQEYKSIIEIESEEELFADTYTERGAGGFGSTGDN